MTIASASCGDTCAGDDNRLRREHLSWEGGEIASIRSKTVAALESGRVDDFVVDRSFPGDPHDRHVHAAAIACNTDIGAFGEDSEIRTPFRCDYGSQTFIGARTFANYGLLILDVATVTIGDDVRIGPNVQLLTPIHPIEPGPRRDKWEAAKPIVIEDNVWLGGGVIVCPGVRIGANTVVGAGAVVTKELPPSVATGATRRSVALGHAQQIEILARSAVARSPRKGMPARFRLGVARPMGGLATAGGSIGTG